MVRVLKKNETFIHCTIENKCHRNFLLEEVNMNYQDSDPLGIYKNSTSSGPGPHLMGANTLIGNDVYDHNDEELGEIKEIMLGMLTAKWHMPSCPSVVFLAWGKNFLPCRGLR
jgi:hypothetical protein